MTRASRLTAAGGLAVCATLLGGCAATVTVRTDPPGGVVVRDGQRLGPAPVTFSDANGVLGHTYAVANPGYVIHSIEAYNGTDLLLRLRPGAGATPMFAPSGVSAPGPLPTNPSPGLPTQPLPAPSDRGDR